MARALQLWNPFRELEEFRQGFDDLWERMLGEPRAPMLTGVRPALESLIKNGHLIIRADLPGIDPKTVEVTVTGDVLTIRGERHERKEEKGRDYLCREIRYGAFERSLSLPHGVKSDEIKASYQHGVLELTMPAPKELAPKKVAVQVEEADGAKGGKKS